MTDTQLPLSFSLAAGHPSLINGLSPADPAAAKPRSLPSPPSPLYQPRLPPVTTGTSKLYIHRAAAAVARASLTDPLNILFLSEMPSFSSSPSPDSEEEEEEETSSISTPTSSPTSPPLPSLSSTSSSPTAATYRALYSSAASRLRAKLAHGAFVAEAGGFAAVACWEPLSLRDAEPRCGADFEVIPAAKDVADGRCRDRPAFAAFAEQVRGLKRRHVDPVAAAAAAGPGGGGRDRGRGISWHVCLTARDPAREYVAGAVRAVLVPFMRRVTGEEDIDGEGKGGLAEWGKGPVWLEAGNERARDVYAHFGFRVAHVIEMMGVRTYGMIYTGNLIKGE